MGCHSQLPGQMLQANCRGSVEKSLSGLIYQLAPVTFVVRLMSRVESLLILGDKFLTLQ